MRVPGLTSIKLIRNLTTEMLDDPNVIMFSAQRESLLLRRLTEDKEKCDRLRATNIAQLKTKIAQTKDNNVLKSMLEKELTLQQQRQAEEQKCELLDKQKAERGY